MTMSIGYFSDLHTESLKSETELASSNHNIHRTVSLEDFGLGLRSAYQEADVIVAAGDIGIGLQAIRFLAATFPDKDVIYVPGNHDYWGSEIHSLQHLFHEACKGTRIHYLEGDTIEISGVLFCGATLWTDYDLMVNSRYSMDCAENVMTDYRNIRVRGESPVRSIDLLSFHKAHLGRIMNAMQFAQKRSMPLVVVTHHAPSSLSLVSDHDRPAMQVSGVRCYGYSDADPYYASHLDDLMKRPDAPQIWIHGHTHIAVSYQIGTCRVVSNPKGYGNGDDTDWQPGRLVEVRRC